MKNFIRFLLLGAMFIPACLLPAQNEKHYSTPSKTVPKNALDTLVWEDFSLFTEGSEGNPVPVPCTRGIINAAYTHQSGWGGSNVYQAGGMMELTNGYLRTPEREFEGHITITFKAKIDSTATRNVTLMGLFLATDEGGVTYELSEYLMASLTLGEDWTEVEWEVDMTYSNLCNFQIQTFGNKCMLDDLLISRPKGSIISPQPLPADNFTPTGFRANWQNSRGADKYLFTLYKEEPESDRGVTFQADFEDGIPEGIVTNCPVVAGEGVDGSKALCLENVGDSIIFPYNGGRIERLTVHRKNVITTPEEDILYVAVSYYDGFSWIGGMEYRFKTEGEMELEMLPDPYFCPAGVAYQLRLDVYRKDGSNKVYFDNVKIEYTSPTRKVMIVEDYATVDTCYVFDSMDDVSEYYYTVKAQNEFMTTEPLGRIHAYGVATPEVLPATDMEKIGKFTANWKDVPRETFYQVYIGQMEKVEEDGEFTVLYEDFSNIHNTYDEERPLALENGYMYLDTYTSIRGWTGYNNILANGMLGFAGGILETPYMDLSGNNGKFTVTLTLYGAKDNVVVIKSKKEGYSIEFQRDGMLTKTFEFSDGDAFTSLKFYALYETRVLLNEIAVTQTLLQGDTVVLPVFYSDYIDADQTSHRFNNFEREDAENQYCYHVVAIYYKWEETYYSVPSRWMPVVYEEESDNEPIESSRDSHFKAYAYRGEIIVDLDNTLQGSAITVFDITGRQVARFSGRAGTNRLAVSRSGLYLVQVNGKTAKVSLIK